MHGIRRVSLVFSSLIFTFFFLPIVLILYYVAEEKYRNYILLVASLFFYSYGEPGFVFVMIGSIVLNYLAAIYIDRYRGTNISKIIMVADTVINIVRIQIFGFCD